MPALSPTMTQGNIGAWKKNEGDEISPGDVLVEIETDKATMDFECQEEGYLAKILVPEGTKEYQVGDPLAVLVEEKGDVAAFKDYKVEAEQKSVPSTQIEEKTAPTSSQPAKAEPEAPAQSGRILASPVAKMLARDNGLDLSQVSGSGPNQRILKHDVLEAIQKGPVASAAKTKTGSTAAYQDIPLTNMRKVIAQRLSDSKQTIPHYYLTSEINMTKLLKARKVINLEGEGKYKISVNDILIKACAMTMAHVPEVNSAWHDTFIRQHSNVDVSVAVATESGLITPIVTDAHLKGLVEISTEVKALVDLAKKNKLRPEQFQGGTFTISNLGMYPAITSFTAIINPPQSCILAVGATQKRTVEGREAQVMAVTMSCDHRVVDGATGARWLGWLKKYLEEPAFMLL